MHLCRHTGILVLMALLIFVSSCVVHDKFPFICFLPDCVAREYRLKGMVKPLKASMALKARRRDNAKIMADIKSQQRTTNGPNKTGYSSRVFYTKYLGTFELANGPGMSIDTIIFFHTSETNRITENDQPRLEHFLKKLPAKKVVHVNVRQIGIADSTENRHVVYSRERQIRKFLKQNDISKTAVFVYPGDDSKN
jgi:hypothetical protein